MTTVLDSFVLELGLDGRPFEEGQRSATAAFKKTQDAALEFGKGLEEKAGKLADLFSVAKKGALGLVGAFAGFEVSGFLNNVLAMDATTGRLAKSIGQSTENLSKWEGMVRAMGGSAGDAQRVFAGVTDAINQYMATTGLPPPALMSLLNRTGVGMSEFTRNPNAAWDRISDFLVAENARQPGMGRFWGQQIPGMTESFLNTLLLGSKGMAELRKEIEAMGFATEQSAHDAMMFQVEATGLEVALENLGRETFPSLIDLANRLTAVVRALKDIGSINSWSGLWDWLKRFDQATSIFGGGGAARGTTPSTGAGALSSNERNFLAGLSFLETDNRNVGNAATSAQGFFQFLRGTAEKAMGAGLPDPRVGNWDQQANATMQFIRKFYPKAADAIDKGDYTAATMILRNPEWPSLPGGSQSQSRSRYETWADILHGGGPRPPGAGSGATFNERWSGFPVGAGAAARGIVNSTSNQHSSNVNVNIGTVTVQTAATDAGAMSRDVASQLRKNLAAAMNFNSSMTG